MADDKKDKMVDFPQYDPERKVPWPPPADAKAPYGEPSPVKEEAAPDKKPYHQDYPSETPTPDPSQTTPGAPNLRDPDTRLPDGEDLSKYSPDIDLKE